MGLTLLELLVVAYLPGAVIFRLPYADRDTRARLSADERAFWATIISVAISCGVVVGLAAVGSYTFPRLLGVNTALSVALVVLARGNMRLGPLAPPPRPAAVIPVALVAVGLWLYFPPAEYILGGRDPGIYSNSAIQIAQHGALLISDPAVASVPAEMRDLFFPVGFDGYRSRFLGFFILDAGQGSVVGRFPHFFPASLAIGYAVGGLDGMLRTGGVWAILGLLAVYFAGSWLLGRPAAAAAAGLLSLHVAQVWFARTPSSELPMQALLFAGLLAYARMEHEGSRFFAPIAASCFGLLLLLRVDAWIALTLVAVAVALTTKVGRHTPRAFLVPMLVWTVVGLGYAATFSRPYFGQQLGIVANVAPVYWVGFGLVLAATGIVFAIMGHRMAAQPSRLPIVLVLGVLGAAFYAYVLRQPGGLLAPHDAYALRNFTSHYLTPYLLVAALAGYALVLPGAFWKSPLIVLMMTGFCAFFFYKIRVVPEHFWMARRFLPVVLPGMLLMVGAAGFYSPWPDREQRWRTLWHLRFAGAILLVGVAGAHFMQQTRAILPHVEYAGAIAKIEQLASRFGPDDMILIEASTLSDAHVLGVPLAYIHGRNVLVLDSPVPEKALFAKFVSWASEHYRHVFFLGGSGTDLLSPSVDVEANGTENFSVPEYERPQDREPREVRQKHFEFGIYRLVAARPLNNGFRWQVGEADDLYVRSFFPKERSGITPYRWSGASSEVLVRMPATAPAHVTAWASSGRRPATASRAQMSVYLDNQLLGTALVGVDGFLPYTFTIPAAERRAGSISVVRIETPTWNPKRMLGAADDRELGVMIQRLEVR